MNSNVNLTTTTYSVSTAGTNPKLTVEKTIVYDYVGCFAASSWSEVPAGSTDATRTFPVCVNESNPWILVGSTNTASSTGNAPDCPEVADVTGATAIGLYRCDLPTESTRVSYYGKMKNQAGDGAETSPSINVMGTSC